MNDKEKNSGGESRGCCEGIPFMGMMQKIVGTKRSSACAEKMTEFCEGMDRVVDCFSMMREMMKTGSFRTSGCDKEAPK